MTRRWHIGRWGPLGWTETALKLAAFAVAIAGAIDQRGLRPDGARGWAVFAIIAVATLGLIAAVADRLMEREIIGMIFIVLAVLGHIAALTVAGAAPLRAGVLAWFAGLMLAGELVKLVFLRTTGFRVRDISPAVVQGLTAAYATMALAVLVLTLTA